MHVRAEGSDAAMLRMAGVTASLSHPPFLGRFQTLEMIGGLNSADDPGNQLLGAAADEVAVAGGADVAPGDIVKFTSSTSILHCSSRRVMS